MNTSTDAASAPVDTPVEVRLGASPHDREDAVRAAGALLVQAGFVRPGYVDSLLLSLIHI